MSHARAKQLQAIDREGARPIMLPPSGHLLTAGVAAPGGEDDNRTVGRLAEVLVNDCGPAANRRKVGRDDQAFGCLTGLPGKAQGQGLTCSLHEAYFRLAFGKALLSPGDTVGCIRLVSPNQLGLLGGIGGT